VTTLAERAQDERGARRAVRPLVILEGIILLSAAPWLLFPDLLPAATVVALLALALVWLLGMAFDRTALPRTPFNLAFVLLGVALGVGILVSADPMETLPKATGVVLGLAVWRFVVIAVGRRPHVALAVGLLLLICLGFSVTGVLSLRELPKIPALTAANPFRNLALPGLAQLSTHPNQLAALISFFLPLLVSLAVGPRPGPSRRLWRVALALVALLVVAILILTQSRGGWIATAAGLFALAALWAAVLPPSHARRGLRLVVGLAVLAALAVAVWIGPTTLWEMWLNPPADTAVGTLRTLGVRRAIWPWGATAVGDFPFTGVGLGAFRQVVFRLYPLLPWPDYDLGHAHNIFLQTALDTGLPGLVAYLAVLFVAAAVGWRVARRDPGFRAVSLGLLAGLVALHVFGLADALVLGAKPAVVFWFALGLLAAMNKEGLET
jgi:putative inorganic carbon (HCO3(-)) transporter